MSNDDFDIKNSEDVSISSDGAAATSVTENSAFEPANPDYFGNHTPDQLLAELEKTLKQADDLKEALLGHLDKERELNSMT